MKAAADSILNQTYRNLEVILVDDGSTDRSPQLCDAWAERDSRIQVFHKSNEGLGYARNSGLACSHGDYICFVDSDDLWSPYFLESLYNALKETDADISQCRWEYMHGDELKEAYECGYEDGYEEAMKEVEGRHAYSRMRRY